MLLQAGLLWLDNPNHLAQEPMSVSAPRALFECCANSVLILFHAGTLWQNPPADCLSCFVVNKDAAFNFL